MEQVEDVQRYRKVIDTLRVKIVAVKDENRKAITKTMARQSVQDWIDASENPDGFFIKSLDNRYDVDGTTLLGWTAEVVKFEWTVRKPKASKSVTVRREPKAQPTHDKNGKRIVYTNGKRVVKRRGMTGATVVKTTKTVALTPEELQARRERLRGGHFVGATYLGK